MATEYQSVEYRLHECLVQMQDMLSVLNFDQSLLDALQECKNLIKNKQYKVAVMGEFKRGKSSLINALLGSRILPADATPTTATINRITYGAAPRAVITFQDGREQEIPVHELKDYVTKITAEGAARALQIKEATVYFPTVFCQNHIDIIDTPGLNDDARMTQITIDMVANVDAVIVPIHAHAPFSETEMKFVCQLIESENITNLVFVVTFLDQLDEDDYNYERFMGFVRQRIQSTVFAELEKRNSPEPVLRKAHQLLDHLQINGISSSLALDSFVSNNRDMLEKSRFEPFRNALLHAVTSKQLEHAIQKTIAVLHSVAAKFDEQDQKRRSVLQDGFVMLEQNTQLLKDYCSNSQRALEDALSRNLSSLQTIISKFNGNKNYIVNEFIKGLSSVRVNSHEVILSALNKAAEQIGRELLRRRTSMQHEMIQILTDSLPPLQEAERQALQAVSGFPDVAKIIGFAETAQSMNRFAETIFRNAVFKLETPYSSQWQNLANCDVIEMIIQAADTSVSNYIMELNQIVSTIRKNWSDQFYGHLKELISCVTKELNQRQEKQDLQYKAYLQNYQTFYQNTQGILKQSEALWSEFEGGEHL